ncbi:PAS domain S-box protein [Flaviaesturariibacter aridisoli]|uniref:histidine kinase n=1 Tax=Flaviaesturariibacter aridisoli TaxID=2545761 RepID=A0A4R4E2P9_9BACT|nr:PAS domain S-box protein [Flaviaesturariibacter aridisoli]TCZ73736.1 PAS domain S-box protein [Flaviaesturariibacter aridisoli]
MKQRVPHSIFELLLESGRTISSEIELETVVQRVTDIGTELSGAQFGAFFYNVVNQAGESYVLYTISGVPREAFSRFPMPRNTRIFEPTFTARGTVRYDDVTKEPHYGKNPPYHGMPEGHLPVRSYLAVPVVNPFTKEAIGGLFFGHEDVGVFTEASEKLIEGMALQAAIAMSNARLFDEKKRIERSLQEERDQYRSIFEASSDSMIIYDENGIIVEANPSACRIFGYAYEELIGQPASRLFANPNDFTKLRDTALAGEKYSGRNTRIRHDGSHFEVQYNGTRFPFRGKPHVLSVARDITEELRHQQQLRDHERKALALLEEKVQERTAELEQRNYDLLQFASVASHDLKEPVRKISIFSQMLEENLGNAIDPASARYLGNIVSSSRRMLRLIDDLLSFSRLSHSELDFAPVDLNELLQRILEDLELPIGEKNAAFHIGTLPTVEGIALQLGQVFQNLIANSLKFVHPGRPPQITLRAEERDGEQGREWVLFYSDNGIGFRPDQSDRIFEVFQRLHTREKFEGTGVGLAIVKRIVDSHHGRIRASGQEGGGATFEIVLPEKQPGSKSL